MSELPKRIKVGYRTYKVQTWPVLEAIGADCSGETCHVSRVIKVDVTRGGVQIAETLLHEILHAIWDVQVMEIKDPEERLVTCFASGLTGVWIDNPSLLLWFNAQLSSKEGA